LRLNPTAATKAFKYFLGRQKIQLRASIRILMDNISIPEYVTFDIFKNRNFNRLEIRLLY